MVQLIRFVAKDIVKNKDLMDVIIHYLTLDRRDNEKIKEISDVVTSAIEIISELKEASEDDNEIKLYEEYKAQLEEIKLSM